MTQQDILKPKDRRYSEEREGCQKHPQREECREHSLERGILGTGRVRCWEHVVRERNPGSARLSEGFWE